MVQLLLGFGRKHRKNILGFCIGASVLLYPPIFSVSSQTPFSFAKSITWKPSPPTSTIPFSSLHSSLLPTSTLSLFSFLHLQEKTKRSYYSLDILQRYCFQLYKLCPCHAARAWTAGIWAPAFGHLQQAQLPKGRLSLDLRTMGCVLGQKIPLWLRVTPFTSMWSWSVALIFNVSYIKQDMDNLCFRTMQWDGPGGI